MLKHKINKDDHAKLSKDLQGLYIEKNGDFFLDVEDADSNAVAELRNAKDREAAKRKELQAQLKEVQDKLADLENADAGKKGDVEKLEKSHKDKLTKLEKDYTDKLTNRDNFVRKNLLDNTAEAMATAISKSPKLLLPHIKSRLDVDFSGDEPKLVIRDANGEPSKLSVDDLKKEFVANKEFSAIIVGSKASGGGADPNRRASGASRGGDGKPASYAEMEPKDLMAVMQERIENNTNHER